MSVTELDKKVIKFPDPKNAREDGLLAVGGDLSVKRLLLAYTSGIFPWYEGDGPYLWWCPRERFIIRPSEVHISHSLQKYIKKHEITFKVDRDFADTMHRCRIKRENEQGTWITDEMEKAYLKLFKRENALSLEAYTDGELSGGLYGVCIGKCFFGESMFSEMENGSKLALIMLCRLLEINEFVMIDCQFHTDHLEKMGGVRISWEEYKRLLDKGLGNTR